MSIFNYTPRESSFITTIVWNDKAELMTVLFKSGAIWSYEGVPQAIFAGFFTSNSAGKYFNENVRNIYNGVFVTMAEDAMGQNEEEENG